MLRQRIITAVILGLAAIAGIIYLPALGFMLIGAVIVALAAWEAGRLFWRQNLSQRIFFIFVVIIMFGVAQMLPSQAVLLVGGAWWLAAPWFLWRFEKDRIGCVVTVAEQWLCGIVVFVPCFISLLVIREDFGIDFFLSFLVIVCAADIGAYFSGRLWGRNLLAKRISPKKTWEGLAGGLVAAVVVALIAAMFLPISGWQWVSWLILAVVTCLWSVVGDLFESLLKRQAKIKDSGSLLPGHGGIYDRIDSMTAAAPIFALGLLLL